MLLIYYENYAFLQGGGGGGGIFFSITMSIIVTIMRSIVRDVRFRVKRKSIKLDFRSNLYKKQEYLWVLIQ